MTRKSQKTAASQIWKKQAATPALSRSEIAKVPKIERRHCGLVPKSSIYKGVTFYKRTGRWAAHMWNQHKQFYLGASFTAQQAARAYDRATIHFRGMEAELNFDRHDYILELKQLMEISAIDLVIMLRKQSAGKGKALPTYPTAPVAPNGLLLLSGQNESLMLGKKIAAPAPTLAVYTAPAAVYTRTDSSEGTGCNKNLEPSNLILLSTVASAVSTMEKRMVSPVTTLDAPVSFLKERRRGSPAH